ncbi:MAG TPA: carboxypeptidase-like regulatory domain-containing protein [Bryobacteraceae bacterium]|nr:carboxypeptidase-like regulatory domain-containing protein [Bryobacteraceae bacterium]
MFATVAAVLTGSMYGQVGRAELFGTVCDPTGLGVSGAVVEALEQRTGLSARSVTSETGQFHFFALPPGNYVLTVTKARFTTLRRTGVVLRVADRVSLDLQLQLGEVSESVEVKAAAPMLQNSEAFVASETLVGTLPLDGRNFVPLVALAPGVALPPGSTLPRINGSRPRTSEYIYDGVSVLQPEPGQVAYFPILDAIGEFRVQINSYSAEYGRSNGGVIQVSSKSGTNELHGTLFEFVRNDALNARNLFALPGPAPFKRNQYGFVVGGPMQKNKTFFFVDWQGTRLRIGNTKTSTVPTTAERQGVFPASIPIYDPATTQLNAAGTYVRSPFGSNTIPRDQFDQAAAALLNHYPAPNVFANGKEAAANNFRRLGIDTTDNDQFDTRLDRFFGERHRLFTRYTYMRDDSAPGTPLPDGSGAISSGVIGDTLTRADSAVADYTYAGSANAVNQLRVGFTRRGFQRSAENLPIFQIAGFQQVGPSESANSNFTTSVTQFIDTYSTIRGRHSLKFGADIRLERLDVLQPPDPLGLYSFTSVFTAALSATGTPLANTGNALASFLTGQVASFNIDVQQQVLKPRATIAEFFVQDDWKPTARLSVGLGLRYTLNFPSTEANDHGAVFNLNSQQLDFLGKNSISRSARRLDWGDFGPRFSLAYQVNDSFVIRSGYGLVWIEQAGITTPFTVPFFPFIQSVGQRSQDNINPAFLLSQGPAVQVIPPNPNSGLGQGVFGVERDTKSGYAQQWNLALQKTFGKNWSAEIGYLGSKLTNLGVPDTNINQLPAADLALGSQLTQQVANPFYGQIPASSTLGGPTVTRQQLLRPFPRFTTVTLFRNNIGNSTYHALAAHLEKRFSAGLTLTASYTFSKLLDDASAVFDAAILTGPVANFPVADSYNRHLEKDLSNGDIPHVFTASFVYQLPFGRGWELGGVIGIQSGMPVAVTQITNFNSFAGYGTERPNRTGDPSLAADHRSVRQYFNTAAFDVAPQFTIGNSSRNPVRGPGYQHADLMLGKIFRLTERANLEFRAEVFNVSNTPPLGQPNGVLGNAAFGSITSALDPRVFELGMKLHF